MFTVKISKLKVHAKIGVFTTERTKLQLLLVTLKFSYKVNKNKDVNNINNIKSYSKIINFLQKYIKSSRYKTLEKLIIESSQALKAQFKIKYITLKIEKPKTAKKYKCHSISVTK